jgi:hypothetical protein
MNEGPGSALFREVRPKVAEGRIFGRHLLEDHVEDNLNRQSGENRDPTESDDPIRTDI